MTEPEVPETRQRREVRDRRSPWPMSTDVRPFKLTARHGGWGMRSASPPDRASRPAAFGTQGVAMSLSPGTVRIQGFQGDEIEACHARPAGPGPRPGVVVVHSTFGHSRSTVDSVFRLARLGYDTICPNLFWREAPGAGPCAAAAMARLAGGVPDERVVGDVAGASAHLRRLSTSTGKVGIVGFGAGAREAVLAACYVDFDAAVDCYGAYLVGPPPDGVFAFQTSSIRAHLPELGAPLLGLFGQEDASPSPAQVLELARILDDEDKNHEFHSYDGAGHGFMSLDHPTYRASVAHDAWNRIATFLARHLGAD